jgi:hypothetical protein
MGKSSKKIASKWLELRVFFLCSLFLIISSVLSQPQTHQVFPPPSGDGTTIIDTITFPGILPGDVVCLMAGTFHQLLIRDIHGLPGQPVTFRNEAGQVIIDNKTHYGISVRNCSYVNFSGNGHPEFQYGIFIRNVEYGAGIAFEKLSTNITLSHFEIANTKLAAIIAKSDPNCTFESLRDIFTMHNITIRNNYIHDVQSEAIYIGHSFYNGFLLNCYGNDTLVLPHVNEGVYVFNNIINRTGRNAIQIGSAYEDCKVFDNLISYDSQLETYNQMGGIIIGGGSVCDCFNNRITNGKGSSIEVFGRGNMMIYNNLILYPGKTYLPDESHFTNPKHGIFVKDVNTDDDATIHIFHNTIISPKSDGISFTNNLLNGSRIQNNIIINPGAYAEIGANAFVHYSDVDLIVSHNLLSLSIDEPCFYDHFACNFKLRDVSPAIDAGIDVSEFGISYDINYDRRPMEAGYDLGAYEKNPDDFDEISPVFRVSPNPFTDHITITFCQQTEGEVALQLFDIRGRRVYDQIVGVFPMGLHRQDFPMQLNHQGVYFLRLTTTGYCKSKSLIFVK